MSSLCFIHTSYFVGAHVLSKTEAKALIFFLFFKLLCEDQDFQTTNSELDLSNTASTGYFIKVHS